MVTFKYFEMSSINPEEDVSYFIQASFERKKISLSLQTENRPNFLEPNHHCHQTPTVKPQSVKGVWLPEF